MTTFVLIVTFWAFQLTGGDGTSGYTSETLPGHYATREACDIAGRAASDNYTGGGDVNWTCVPVEAK